MITIAIINLKGGVGKSVTTVNLAAELAALNKSILVVDLDKQANTTKFYEALDYEVACVADVLTEDQPAEDVICETKWPAIGLLPANMRLLKANRQILMDTTEPQQTRLRDALESVAQHWDAALLDCPPDLDMGSINALCAADYVIVPVDCDEWAVDGLQEILDQMDRIRMYYNPRLQLLGILVTKFQHTKYAKETIRELSCWDVPMLSSVIRYSTVVKEAKSAHAPLRIYGRKCKPAADYKDLALEVIKKVWGEGNV